MVVGGMEEGLGQGVVVVVVEEEEGLLGRRGILTMKSVRGCRLWWLVILGSMSEGSRLKV